MREYEDEPCEDVATCEDMSMVELALSEVQVRRDWSARAEPSRSDIAEAAKRFAQQPMLHPPTVAQRGERWVLVSGRLRLEVWRHLGYERGLFRWVRGSDQTLLLLNFAENVARRALAPHELVQRVVFLRDRGIDAKEIAKHSGYSVRYVRQLAAIRRDAHAELWMRFVQGEAHLGIAVMLDLVAHPAEEQLERWLMAQKHWRRADTAARGFSEEEGDEALSAGATPRRRFPRRREVKKLLAAVMSEEALEEDYRKGVVDALRWMLFDTELGTRFSWSTLRGLDRRGAKVIPIRVQVDEQDEDVQGDGVQGESGGTGADSTRCEQAIREGAER